MKITRGSRDGGVDAVAFDPDPIRGGKIVIQAKRYTNTVGISAVRDLYAVVVHEGATKGILVTTSSFGSDSYEFASDKPLTLINDGELLYLLEKHGHKAYVDVGEEKKLGEQQSPEDACDANNARDPFELADLVTERAFASTIFAALVVRGPFETMCTGGHPPCPTAGRADNWGTHLMHRAC